MVVRIVGIGQRAGGDDGAGPAVIDRLRMQNVDSRIELCEVAEPSALMPLLENASRVIVVDATLDGERAGQVLVISPSEIDSCAITSVSTHGMSVGQAIELARVLSPETVCPDIRILAITAQRPIGIQIGLSAEVAGAIDEAARTAEQLAMEH